jgi:hypothetical protein
LLAYTLEIYIFHAVFHTISDDFCAFEKFISPYILNELHTHTHTRSEMIESDRDVKEREREIETGIKKKQGIDFHFCRNTKV